MLRASGSIHRRCKICQIGFRPDGDARRIARKAKGVQPAGVERVGNNERSGHLTLVERLAKAPGLAGTHAHAAGLQDF